MNRGIDLVELQQAIFRYCTKRSLRKLAVTCLAFKEVALNELWRHQDTLANLTKLFGLTQNQIQALWGSHNSDIIEDFSEAAWGRVDYYASKIRVFHIHAAGLAWELPPRMIDIFHRRQSSIGRKILPNLNAIMLRPISGILHRAFASLILNPNIRYLRIDVGSDDHNLNLGVMGIASFCVIFAELVHKDCTLDLVCPEKLLGVVEAKTGPSTSRSWISFLKGSMPANVEITDSLSITNTFGHLQHLRHLRELKLSEVTDLASDATLPQGSSHDPNVVHIESVAFEHLTSLHLKGRFSEISNALQILSAPIRTLIVVMALEYEQLSDMPLLTMFMESISQLRSLEELKLTVRNVYGNWTTNRTLGGIDSIETAQAATAVLSSLFRLHDLRTLELDMLAEKLDNSWLVNVPEAWPHLESLHLTSSRESSASQMTLDGLIPIALHCRKLKDLQITLNARFIQKEPPELPLDFMGNRTLRKLLLVRSMVDHSRPRKVMEYILRLFPALYKAQGCWENVYESKGDSPWPEVNSILKECILKRDITGGGEGSSFELYRDLSSYVWKRF